MMSFLWTSTARGLVLVFISNHGQKPQVLLQSPAMNDEGEFTFLLALKTLRKASRRHSSLNLA